MLYVSELDSNNEITIELADCIVGYFEAMLIRPTIYIGRDDSPEAVIGYIQGFESAIRLAFVFPPPYNRDYLSHRFFRSRGWSSGYYTPLERLRKGKMDEVEIVREILKFEIEKWKAFRREVFFDSFIE